MKLTEDCVDGNMASLRLLWSERYEGRLGNDPLRISFGVGRQHFEKGSAVAASKDGLALRVKIPS